MPASHAVQTPRNLVAGKYLLGDELGAGGMGVVYRAQQLRPSRPVAIKFLHRVLARDPRTVARFRDEALTASRLDHPNSVAVLDHGENDDGTPYLVMEYVSGRTLRHIVDDGPLPIARAIAITRQVLGALACAHAHDIVHSDVKTENVLVQATAGREHVKLVDFGLARVILSFDEEDRATSSDAHIAGTPEYMAPEVILGGTPSPASDIYAVGVILHEMVTGTTPFGGGKPMDIFQRHVLDPIVPPSVRFPQLAIPRRLEEVIERALAKEPQDRFPDAAAFAEALDRCEAPPAGVQLPAVPAETSRAVGARCPTLRARPLTVPPPQPARSAPTR
ncbi:MAG: serine/threonine protein kinase [Deltaproteobacteria bacterium]|nr:serine/threonine protein kinase [Kofleriaceae bacterium]